MSGLQEVDLDAVQEAVGVLRAEGFRVHGANEVGSRNHGVEFDLTVFKDTRTKPMNPVAEAFRSAVREAFAEVFSPDEEGPAVLVTLDSNADPEEWTRKLRNEGPVTEVRNATVVETPENEQSDDPDDLGEPDTYETTEGDA